MGLAESGEMYLETIYVLTRHSTSVRSIDVAESMGYSKPSVSRAIGILKAGEYIEVDRSGFITLTEKGEKTAESLYERHTILTDLLISLGVSNETAAVDACKIEHVISAESIEAIKNYINKNNSAE
ncbi:MAG: metal-dependent transcriptional regulator [Clostridia bacterium]|nr:metal-dependent transcriptional regulator [Clostridia bacterium]